jgi:DNA-binding NtrC family response regulator
LRLPRTVAAILSAAPAIAAPAVSREELVSESEKPAADARAHLKEMERRMIVEALERNLGNKAAVARELGIPLSTLKRRLKEYRIGDEE